MGDTISVGDLTAIPAVQRQVTPGQVSCFDYLVYCKLKHGLMSQVYSAGLETFIPEFYNLITYLLTYKDLQKMGFTWEEAEVAALDRHGWRRSVAQSGM